MFDSEKFKIEGDHLVYEDKFVAKFNMKDHLMVNRAIPAFISFLVQNFEPEEYFKLLETELPLSILRSKGYVSPLARRVLINFGYNPTKEGLELYEKETGKTLR